MILKQFLFKNEKKKHLFCERNLSLSKHEMLLKAVERSHAWLDVAKCRSLALAPAPSSRLYENVGQPVNFFFAK